METVIAVLLCGAVLMGLFSGDWCVLFVVVLVGWLCLAVADGLNGGSKGPRGGRR